MPTSENSVLPGRWVNSVGCLQSVLRERTGRLHDVGDLDAVLEQFKQAGQEFVKGTPEPVQELFSHREDVTLANPFGPPARGWEQVAAAQERGASVFKDGEIYDFETIAK